jgi:hypothetical protein
MRGGCIQRHPRRAMGSTVPPDRGAGSPFGGSGAFTRMRSRIHARARVGGALQLEPAPGGAVLAWAGRW